MKRVHLAAVSLLISAGPLAVAAEQPGDIVGAAIAPGADRSVVFAWYRDGMVSVGTVDRLDQYKKPYRFIRPSSVENYSEIVEMAMNDVSKATPDAPVGDRVWTHTWYRNGMTTRGTSIDLAKEEDVHPFALPE